jgi:hypothetical protein
MCITAQQWRWPADVPTWKRGKRPLNGGLDFRWLSLLRPLRGFRRELLPMMGPLSPQRLTLRILRHVCQPSAGFGFQTQLGRVVDHMHQPSGSLRFLARLVIRQPVPLRSNAHQGLAFKPVIGVVGDAPALLGALTVLFRCRHFAGIAQMPNPVRARAPAEKDQEPFSQ